jgi:hypothetical protein
MTIKSQN